MSEKFRSIAVAPAYEYGDSEFGPMLLGVMEDGTLWHQELYGPGAGLWIKMFTPAEDQAMRRHEHRRAAENET